MTRPYEGICVDLADYVGSRAAKANKTLAVIQDALAGQRLADRSVLEIGCFRGDVSEILAPVFQRYVAIDVLEEAIKAAQQRERSKGGRSPEYQQMNATDLKFANDQFDVVIYSHIYEYVSDPQKAMAEICRVLKPGGICYFAAGNRWVVMEPHYRLPFLSWIPHPLAGVYLRLAKGGSYGVRLYSHSELKKLAKGFERVDYTGSILSDPERFRAADQVPAGSIKQKLAVLIYRLLPGIFPSYVWILRKPDVRTATT